MKKSLFAACGLSVLGLTPAAFGNTITPGSTAAPDILTVGPTATLLATVSGTISPGTFTATYTNSVYSDPNNTFCAGCDDFVYKVTNTGSSGVVERVTGYSFDTTILTDVGYTPGTGLAPTSVDRSASGKVVGFNFLGTAEIGSGQSTDTLVIETNTTAYSSGLVSLQDGSAGTNVGLQPSTAPEPVSMGLLGGGLAFLGLARFRKAKKS